MYSLNEKPVLKTVMVLLLFGIFTFQNVNFCQREHRKSGVRGVIHSDAYWYYMYAPELFIHGKFTNLPNCAVLPNGNSINKYTMGVSIMQLPFFFTSYLIDNPTSEFPQGYSNTYGYGVLMATVVYAFLGLLMMFLFLRKKFGPYIAWIGVLITYFGTNMFHYVYFEPGMSHVYSFFCISGVVFFTDKFYIEGNRIRYFIVASVMFSMAVLIRPTNFVMVFWILLYGVTTGRDFIHRLEFWLNEWKKVILFSLILFLVLLPQLYYWHSVTGQWLFNTYNANNEGFTHLSSPHFFEIFFGVQNGWVIYSPIMILFFVGLFYMVLNRNGLLLPTILVFVSISYFCASWWAYNFPCAFGYRSFVEFYPVFIIPVSAFSFYLLSKRNRWVRWSFLGIATLLTWIGLQFNLAYSSWPFCTEFWSWDGYLDILKKMWT